MEKINIITHKACRIVYFDAKNLNENEVCTGIVKLTDISISNRINCILIDVTGTHTTPKVKETAASNVKRSTEKLGKIYSALVGLSQLQRIIANAISRDQYFASNLEDAKNWLEAKYSKAK